MSGVDRRSFLESLLLGAALLKRRFRAGDAESCLVSGVGFQPSAIVSFDAQGFTLNFRGQPITMDQYTPGRRRG
jgi:hypothetical protein